MARGTKLRILAEHAAFRTGLCVAACLPPRAALALGRLLGLAFFYISPHRRHRALDNLQMALGLAPDEARRLARRSYAHLGESVAENVIFWRRLSGDNLDRHVEIVGLEHVRRTRAAGRGAIFVTGHLGNWELGGLLTAHLWGGLTSIAEMPSNPRIEAALTRFRSRAGQEIVPRKGSLPLMLRRLREGKAVGIVMDVDARRRGIVVPFFGQPASTTPTPARLSLLTGAPILPGFIRRVGPLRHHVIYYPPVRPRRSGNRRQAVAECTARLNDLLEEAIRRAPEQWTWLHKRWRTGLRWRREMGPDAPYGGRAGHFDD